VVARGRELGLVTRCCRVPLLTKKKKMAVQ